MEVVTGQLPSSPSVIEWSSFSLTHVQYPKGDSLGKLLAFISLSPLGIAVCMLTLILFRRDLHTITFSSGILLNEVMNYTLKHLIREPRPLKRQEEMTVEFGMPSSHSQFMWFVATYLMFFITFRLHHGSNNNSVWEGVWRHLLIAGGFFWAGAVAASRVYLEYHTLAQVMAGGALGALAACAWFALTHCVFTPLFPYICSWRISELLLLRDTTLIPNVMWFEYTSYRQESRTRQRKLTSMKSQ
ncbi:dolichyldiphosphatase 1-like isoform X1 [Varroa jacobsoni]|uniref:Dolichyldiphosphatase n=1 Tax=Varroa destructor TaxID=109461 RepID=A0A7M7KK10_VARDE|nr:dolichyldiphosphatase 1-like isoform X1 [Varroa destructor]XP_022667927.1 dolichyldiphosphatase 1-like isoform X1 [Varroa destructor]XP_022667935.1 dolichyldiphosphatase 1-like isoform X1 [Varroa destructor]XP_022701267.1 dolichyldiphosphatase 1-like isoform X1 [Varroa jacobsoni]XP_022701268.1 dolichyldiphosphatase 1-like isoform X1 [Varroa jacobsoni]XP_022701269.1 dolichyldiphosphatase 1-like isoform X1 [Varroa jacobsoni]